LRRRLSEWARRLEFELYISEVVIAEASAGDPEAAAERMRLLSEIPVLISSGMAETLAKQLIDELAIPPAAIRDAAHVAIATVHGIEYLLTWNCRHLANLQQRARIEQVCRDHGFEPPIIGTPAELLEVEP
jgi:hypothetical protein